MLYPRGTFWNSSGKAISESAKVIKQANIYHKAHISKVNRDESYYSDCQL